MAKIAIIGAGISGLSTGFNLAVLLDERKQKYTIDIYEKNRFAGGTIRSVSEKGFTVETGPNGFLDSKPSTLELCSRLGIDGKLFPADVAAKRRYIFYKDKLIRVPETPQKFVTSDMMSWKGKYRLFMEPFIPKGSRDLKETVGEFGKRRIGLEAVENMLDPMVTGIFAGNPWKMSLKACFPRIWEMEQTYGSLTKALFAIKRKRKSAGPAGPSGILTSFHEGTQFLIDSLAGRKEINLMLSRPAQSISHSNKGWKVNGKAYDIVISALPSYVFADLIEGFAENAANKLRKIPYSPMAVVGMGFKKDITSGKNDGFGFLIPNREKRKILGCLFSSNIFPGRAPKEYDLLQVMLGGARFTEIIDMSDDEIKQLAIDEIKSILRLNGDPDFVKIFSWENAIPQYMREHLDLIDEIKKDFKDFDNLFFTGNAYYGIGINDCTKAAYETAETVASYLQRN